MTATRGRKIGGRLDVVHELSSRFLVWTSDEFAERAVDRNEDFVAFVELETVDERAVWPGSKTVLDLGDDRVKSLIANCVQHVRLQLVGVKLAIVITRQTL